MTTRLRWIQGLALDRHAAWHRLKGTSRELEEHAYLVSDDAQRVLVLAKLESLARGGAIALADLIDGAWTTPLDAVETWSIMPYPFTVELAPGGAGWRIRHAPFCSILPGLYPTRAAAAPALARLLAGMPVSGDGDFHYRGQPLMLEAPLDPQVLPQRPLLSLHRASALRSRKRLVRLDFIRGFPPLTESLFNRISYLESSWLDECTALSQALRSADLAACLTTLLPPVPGAGDFVHARLAKLAARYAHPDHVVGLFELGHAAIAEDQPEDDYEHAVLAGEVAAYALAQGAQSPDALHLAWRWHRYDIGLRTLTRRVETTLLFLLDDSRTLPVSANPALRFPEAQP